jgi:hypothetical protein
MVGPATSATTAGANTNMKTCKHVARRRGQSPVLMEKCVIIGSVAGVLTALDGGDGLGQRGGAVEGLQAILKLQAGRAPARRADTHFGTFASCDFAMLLNSKEYWLYGQLYLTAAAPNEFIAICRVAFNFRSAPGPWWA